MSGERITTHEHDGLVFTVRDEGPPDGPVVLLLHGFPETSSTWDAVVPRLHAAGLRTLALDQRGYSPGARPRGRRAYRLSRLVADAASLAQRVGPVHLVSHDWGAVVGWALAGSRPDLVRTHTAFSVPPAGTFWRSVLTSRQVGASWYIFAFQVPGLAERAARTGAFEQHLAEAGMTEHDLARFRTDMVRGGALPGGLAWYRAVWFMSPRLARARVRVPSTMVWSDGDVAVTERNARAAQRYVEADFRFETLTGVTHWIPTEAPAEAARLVLDRIGS